LAIAIYAEHRGLGLGSRLLDYAVKLAAQSGARGVSIVVEDTNSAAVALYLKNEFERMEALPWIAYGSRSGPSYWLMMTKTI
jgi:ribosomal protein S18 acetylase RimI-like enzyme